MPRLIPKLWDVASKTSAVLLYPFRRKLFEIDQKRYWSQRAQSNHNEGEQNDRYYAFFNQTIVGSISRLEDAASILEVGCYCGERMALLKNSFPAKRIVGCDFGAVQLSLCQERFSGQPVELVNGDGRCLPFKTNCFDLVFTSGCLEHVPFSDAGQVVSELARVSRRYVMVVEAYIRPMSVRQKMRYVTFSYFYMHDYERLMRKSGLGPMDMIPLRDETGHPRYSLLLFSKKVKGIPATLPASRSI